MVLTMRSMATWPSAATPGVMTATPPGKVLTHCGQWFEFGPRSYDDPKHAKPAEFYDGIAKKAVQRFDKDAEPWFAKPPAR